MARPKHKHPTPAELEVLNVLWEHGPMTVRDVMGRLHSERGYTTVMSLLQVMFDKGLLSRRQQGRAFQYAPKAEKDKTRKQMLGDLLCRAFNGSSSALVVHLLEHSAPDDDELSAIRQAIQLYEQGREDKR
jgi:predicted transcriptional regulator